MVRGTDNDGITLTSRAALVRCRAERNGYFSVYVVDGSFADGVVSAVDLVSVGNYVGAYVYSAVAAHNVSLDLDHALVSGNALNGVAAEGGAGGVHLRVTNSTVTENGLYGFYQSGTAVFESLGNNLVAGNQTGDTVGMITLIAGH